MEEIESALNDFGNRLCKQEHVETNALKEWKVSIFKIVEQRIEFYLQNTNLLPPKPKSTFRHLKRDILTRCYTQHALRLFIDSEINHKRHFIKIPFINKGIEFIDLPSIFKDRSVTSSIPAYFQNSEPPIICYKYNKPIRNTVFNFNKLVSDLDIHANTPESWDCKDSKFMILQPVI